MSSAATPRDRAAHSRTSRCAATKSSRDASCRNRAARRRSTSVSRLSRAAGWWRTSAVVDTVAYAAATGPDPRRAGWAAGVPERGEACWSGFPASERLADARMALTRSAEVSRGIPWSAGASDRGASGRPRAPDRMTGLTSGRGMRCLPCPGAEGRADGRRPPLIWGQWPNGRPAARGAARGRGLRAAAVRAGSGGLAGRRALPRRRRAVGRGGRRPPFDPHGQTAPGTQGDHRLHDR